MSTRQPLCSRPDCLLHAERELFVENVWREIGLPDSVDRLAFHKNESAALQKILPLLTVEQLCDVLAVLRAKSGRAFMSPYASHIVQALLLALAAKSKAQSDAQSSSRATEAIVQLCEALKGQLVEIIFHACGTHPFRALVSVLAGIDASETPKDGGPPPSDDGGGDADVNKEFFTCLRDFVTELTDPETEGLDHLP